MHDAIFAWMSQRVHGASFLLCEGGHVGAGYQIRHRHSFISAGLCPSLPCSCTFTRDPAALLIFHRHGDRSPLRGHTPDEELALPTVAAIAGGGGATTSSEGIATAARTAEDFWRRQLVPQEDVQRLNELFPVRRSPGEAVPPDEVSQLLLCQGFIDC